MKKGRGRARDGGVYVELADLILTFFLIVFPARYGVPNASGFGTHAAIVRFFAAWRNSPIRSGDGCTACGCADGACMRSLRLLTLRSEPGRLSGRSSVARRIVGLATVAPPGAHSSIIRLIDNRARHER